MALNFPDSPADGDIFQGYIYDANRGVWDAKLVSSNALNDLSDIDTTGLADGQALIYDATAGKWGPGSAAPSGVKDLSSDTIDVDFSDNIPLEKRTVAGDVTFTGTNYTAGVKKEIKLENNTLSDYLLSFPANWNFYNTKPEYLWANNQNILSLSSYSTSDTGIVALWLGTVTPSVPGTTYAATSAQQIVDGGGTESGAYTIVSPYDGVTEEQIYCDLETIPGTGYALAMTVTNATGNRADWFDGDSSMSGATGTDYFTAVNASFGTFNSLQKTNSRTSMFHKPFTKMLMIENTNGVVGYKEYQLSSENSLHGWFGTPNGGYTNRVSSVLTSSGSFRTLTDTIAFNYDLYPSSDGARMAFTSVSNEATGGISARVDGARGYETGWSGNITGSGSRSFGSDGTVSDHTIWILIN